MPESLTPYLGFAVFVVVSIITPGPNNIMILHSGARYGIRRTIPLIAGIQVGFAVMMAIISYGSSVVLTQIDNAAEALRIICFMYLLYLAWRIGASLPPNLDNPDQAESLTKEARPIRLVEAALFQWVNPKAWSVAMAAVGTYGFVFSGPIGSVIGFSGTFMMIGFPSCFMWASGGRLIAPLLRSPERYRAFSITAAIIMVAAVVPALLSF